jgi:arabinofuranan 3-O-arabinosyltransferase
VLLFGPQMWIDFAHNADALRTIVLEDGTGLWHRTISVFMLVRRLTGSIDLAYAVQAVAALIAAGIVALAWFRDVSVPARNTLLVLGTFLATPYLQDYDLVVGAFVAVWVLGPAGFARSDDRMAQVAALLILVLPLVAASLARMSGLSLGALLMLPAFILAGRAIPAARPAAEAAR